MRALHAAIGLFTIVPVPPFDVDRAAARRAMAAFPWVGLLLGAVAGLAGLGVSTLGSPLLGAVAAMAVLAGSTGALHLDGVADTADGLGSRKPAEQALEIMRRSDIGPMGVVTILFVLLADIAAVASMPTGWSAAAAVACAAMVARAWVSIATVSTVGARESGFGALFVGATRRSTAVVTAVLVASACAGLGWLTSGLVGLAGFLGAAAASGLVAAGWARHLRRRLGGWTGDTFGSLIEVGQACFLVVAALVLASA